MWRAVGCNLEAILATTPHMSAHLHSATSTAALHARVRELIDVICVSLKIDGGRNVFFLLCFISDCGLIIFIRHKVRPTVILPESAHKKLPVKMSLAQARACMSEWWDILARIAARAIIARMDRKLYAAPSWQHLAGNIFCFNCCKTMF